METFSISAHKQQPRRLWMTFIFFAALLLATFHSPTPAFSQDDKYVYYWSLTFEYEGSADGILTVTVGYDDNGIMQQPPLVTKSYGVPCARNGNAGVSGGVLKLNGGYFSCNLDLQGSLQDAFATCNALVPGCHQEIEDVELYANFRALAKVMSANLGEAPIFYHENASYTINPQSSLTQITASLTPHGIIPSTPVVSAPALNVWQNYAAEYFCDPSCEMYYSVAGATEVIATPDADVEFSTPLATVYVGHNPATGLTAPAGTTIDRLFIDPPNFGND